MHYRLLSGHCKACWDRWLVRACLLQRDLHSILLNLVPVLLDASLDLLQLAFLLTGVLH